MKSRSNRDESIHMLSPCQQPISHFYEKKRNAIDRRDLGGDSARMELGERVNQLRRMKGLSQAELAKRAGLGQSQISDIETRKIEDPEGTTLERLAKGLECTIADLLPFDGIADLRSRVIAEDLANRYGFDILIDAVRCARGSAQEVHAPPGANSTASKTGGTDAVKPQRKKTA